MRCIPLLIITISFMGTVSFAKTEQIKSMQIHKKIEELEKIFDGKIGIYAMDTNSHQIVAYRANERFPVQSTFKFISVAAILKKSMTTRKLLQQKIIYKEQDYHPVHVTAHQNC